MSSDATRVSVPALPNMTTNPLTSLTGATGDVRSLPPAQFLQQLLSKEAQLSQPQQPYVKAEPAHIELEQRGTPPAILTTTGGPQETPLSSVLTQVVQPTPAASCVQQKQYPDSSLHGGEYDQLKQQQQQQQQHSVSSLGESDVGSLVHQKVSTDSTTTIPGMEPVHSINSAMTPQTHHLAQQHMSQTLPSPTNDAMSDVQAHLASAIHSLVHSTPSSSMLAPMTTSTAAITSSTSVEASPSPPQSYPVSDASCQLLSQAHPVGVGHPLYQGGALLDGIQHGIQRPVEDDDLESSRCTKKQRFSQENDGTLI
uniref:Uncharacterized protein n=1 Tax=Octactis speculum TaxID=3111310 RepID=A0A7S2D0E4_9STRA